jgi:hypothetical protein
MWQTIVVVAIVATALVFTLRRTLQTVKGKSSCACTGCDNKGSDCSK